METLQSLLAKIKSTNRKHLTLLIGIDGFGGSGKSTVAKFLRVNLANASIVEMDDFYSPSLQRADYARVKQQVLEPLARNEKASYQIYEWKTDSLSEFHEIIPGGIIIIEGVYSINKDLAANYDVKIWVDCPAEVGAARGIERDKFEDGIDKTDKWLNIWMPKEKEYVAIEKPQEYADYIISGQIKPLNNT